MPWYLHILATAIPAGLAAFFGARLSFHLYRSQRWFDKRYEVMCDLLECLNMSIAIPRTLRMIDALGVADGTQAWRKDRELKESKLKDANERISRIMGVRHFLFPNEITETLDEFDSRRRSIFAEHGRDTIRLMAEDERLMSEMHIRLSEVARTSLSVDVPMWRSFSRRLRCVWPFRRSTPPSA